MPRIKAVVGREPEYKRNLETRNLISLVPLFEEGLRVYSDLRRKKTELDDLRANVNRLSKRFEHSRDEALVAESRQNKDQIKRLEEETREIEDRLQKLEIRLPNWLNDGVPTGAGDEAERPLWYRGRPAVFAKQAPGFQAQHPTVPFETFEYEPFHHYDFVGSLIEQEVGGRVAQTRFYYELDALAILDMALSMYAVEFFLGRKYDHKFMIPPYMMRRAIEERATYFEGFQDTIFQLPEEELILIPSSEHSILAFYEDQIIPGETLPMRITAWSPCFRKEAGAHGIDTRGIFRVKQFHKVELQSMVPEGEDDAEMNRYAEDISAFMSSLGIPHRAVEVPAGDMDKRAHRQIDIQAWMPGQSRYRETHSIATLGTWASEKLAIRYRKADKKIDFVRNVYATAVAVQRTMCVIAENHYDHTKKAIVLPEVLHKYTMGRLQIELG